MLYFGNDPIDFNLHIWDKCSPYHFFSLWLLFLNSFHTFCKLFDVFIYISRLINGLKLPPFTNYEEESNRLWYKSSIHIYYQLFFFQIESEYFIFLVQSSQPQAILLEKIFGKHKISKNNFTIIYSKQNL